MTHVEIPEDGEDYEPNQPQKKGVFPSNLPEWQMSALHDLQYTSLSYSEIGRKYGRARDTVIKLRKRFGVVRPEQAKSGPSNSSSTSMISPSHRAVGNKLTGLRNGGLLTDLGNSLGISRIALKSWEMGVHDFTLTELAKIAGLLDVSIEELIKPVIMKKPGRG